MSSEPIESANGIALMREDVAGDEDRRHGDLNTPATGKPFSRSTAVTFMRVENGKIISQSDVCADGLGFQKQLGHIT